MVAIRDKGATRMKMVVAMYHAGGRWCPCSWPESCPELGGGWEQVRGGRRAKKEKEKGGARVL